MPDKSEAAGQTEQPAPGAAPAQKGAPDAAVGSQAPAQGLSVGGTTRPPRLPRKAAPPSLLGLSPRKTMLLLGAVAAVAGALLVTVIIKFAGDMTAPIAEGAPKLAAEFEERANNYTIRPPVNWVIEDRHDGANIFIKGPKERGFPPLIVVSMEIKPGGIESYMREHKGRIAFQAGQITNGPKDSKDKAVKWISEETDSIDGCPNTVRLEYECNTVMNDETIVRVRALQYIMEDKPRFYRLTGFVSPENFEKYLQKFEACMRSFKRTPLPNAAPQVLP